MITPFNVIIFHGQQLLSFYVIFFPCMYIFCVIIYFLIFRALSFTISFDVIIFHGQQMLSFLCYHFPFYIFCVIIMFIVIVSPFSFLREPPAAGILNWLSAPLGCNPANAEITKQWRTAVFGTDPDRNGALEETPRSWTDSCHWLNHLGVRAP